ncbi:MAG: molybdenum cofactor guanylyltransferase [Ilumatobacteraceae bacterium]|jgi:molybdopterin-guanine dinucleotide biosynthesis protein A
MPAVAVTPVLLVGGASRRMGEDKSTLDVGGTPAAVRVAAVLAGACGIDVSEVVCVGGPPERARSLGLMHVPDDDPGAGPLAALDTVLRRLDGDCLVAACDLLGIDHATAVAVLRAGDRPACDVAVASGPDGRRQPLMARWNSVAAPVVAEAVATGERSPSRLLGRLRVVEVPCAEEVLLNVNDPDGLRLLRARIRDAG